MWSRIIKVFARKRRAAEEAIEAETLRQDSEVDTRPSGNSGEISLSAAESAPQALMPPSNGILRSAADRRPGSSANTRHQVSETPAHDSSAQWAAARTRPMVYAHKLRMSSEDHVDSAAEARKPADGFPDREQFASNKFSASESSLVSVEPDGEANDTLGASTDLVTPEDFDGTEDSNASSPPSFRSEAHNDVHVAIPRSTAEGEPVSAFQPGNRFAMLRAVANQLRVTPVTCRYLVIVGSVTEGRKLAPIIRALRSQTSSSEQLTVCAAGERPDRIREALQIFGASVDLELKSSTHRESLEDTRTRMITGFGRIFLELKPAWLLVQGSSTVAAMASIAAYYAHIPVAHLDGSVSPHDLHRDDDESDPEVLHRLIASLFASVHFTETAWSKEVLMRAGVPEQSILVTGNTSVDVMQETCALLGLSVGTSAVRSSGVIRVLVVTESAELMAHHLPDVCKAIRSLATSVPGLYQFVWPLPPDQGSAAVVSDLLDRVSGVLLLDPATYEGFLRYLSECDLVLTDLEDIQEEAPSFGKPVLLMRQSAQRPEALRAGITTLCGTDALSIQAGVRALSRKLSVRHGSITNPFGDGKATARILDFFEGRQVLEFGRTALPRLTAIGGPPRTRLLAASSQNS